MGGILNTLNTMVLLISGEYVQVVEIPQGGSDG